MHAPNDEVRYIFHVIAKTAFTQHHDFEEKLDKKAHIYIVGKPHAKCSG